MASRSGLRTAARVALVGGAAGSVVLMMRAGARQRSVLLIFLFTAWVLSPFIALALANLRAARWTDVRRIALYGATLGVAFISLSVYAIHALIPGMKAGFIYLVVPGACWVLIGMAFATSAAFSAMQR